MSSSPLKKINNLLYQFRNLKRYSKVSLPLKTIDEFKKIPLCGKKELKSFNKTISRAPVFNVTATSGTTASRLTISHSADCYRAHLNRVAKTYRCAGIGANDLCLNICSYAINSGGRIMEQAFRKIGAGVIPFGIVDTREKFVKVAQLVKQFRPTVVNAYTNQVYSLFSVLGKNHGLKKCIVDGEPLTSAFRQKLENISGAEIYDNYGSMEFSAFAMTRKSGEDYMEIFEDGLYIEVMTNSGSVQECGVGRIIVTDLENTSMPFIRYELGDEVDIIKKGRKKYIKVLGRSEGSILINGEIYHQEEIVRVLRDRLGHSQFFILVEKDQETFEDYVTVNVPVTDRECIDVILDDIEKELRFDCPVRIRIHSGDVPTGPTGKALHIIDLRKKHA